MLGAATSVAIFKYPCRLTAPILPSTGAACCAPTNHKRLTPQERLVRRFFRNRHGNAVLFLPVTDGGLDGVFGKHGAMNLHRRERELAHDVRVLDRKRLFDRLALYPLWGERGAGDGRTPTEGLELCFFNEVGVRVCFYLELSHLAPLRASDATPAPLSGFPL